MSNLLTGFANNEYLQRNGQLLSEGELSKVFNVSRSTVREALSKLEQGGYIWRRHGVGTFLAGRSQIFNTGLEQLESINSLAVRKGLQISMDGLKVIERAADENEIEIFSIEKQRSVTEIQRLMVSEGRPIAYLVDVLPQQADGYLSLIQDFEGSVLDLLLQKSHFLISHANTDISVRRLPDKEIAKKMVGDPTESLLCFESRLYTSEGLVVDHSFSYFVPGFFTFNVIRRVPHPDIGELAGLTGIAAEVP